MNAPLMIPSPMPYQRLVAPLEAIPEALRDLSIWCAWRLIQKDGKPGKKPVSPITGSSDGWTRDGFCTTADKAIAFANDRSDLHGIGLVVGNGISGGDLDNCVVDGQPSPMAQIILADADTYTELSPGLNGYRFLFLGSFGGHTGNNKAQGVEFYEDNRFLTFTGNVVPGMSTELNQRDLSALGRDWFESKGENAHGRAAGIPDKHVHIDIDSLKISEGLKDRIRNGADKGARSEMIFQAAKDMLRAGLDEATVCHILTDKAYAISDKAFDERGSQPGAMQWVMKYTIQPARQKIDEETIIISSEFKPVLRADAGADEEWPWEDPADIFDKTISVTEYQDGYLPQVYEGMMNANWRYHVQASREPYAGFFSLSVDSHLRPSVRVEETPGSGINGGQMLSVNDQVGAVSPSTKAKTPTLMHAVGLDGEAPLLMVWNKREQVAANARFAKKADEIRKRFKGDDKAIGEQIKALKAEMPMPDIVNSKITDKAMVETNAANDRMDLPMNIIVDEWEHVYGGAAYRRDGGNAISDIHRKMADNFPYSDKSSGGGKISSDRMAGNLGFSCTPSDMAQWPGYKGAMSNGDMARKSLFAAGKPFSGERDKVIDSSAIAAWRHVQEQLQDIRELKLYLEEDFEFEAKTEKEVMKWGAQADEGDHVVRWLAKIKIRCARFAAALYLVDEVAAGRKPEKGVAIIPKIYRRRAWRFLTQFAWPHQVYVHGRLIAGESFNTALGILLRRIYVNGKTTLKADDITGGKSSPSLRSAGEELIKALLFNFKWIRPKQTRVSYNRQRPWEAHQFEVNPGLFEIYRRYDSRIREAHEVAKGQIEDIFG